MELEITPDAKNVGIFAARTIGSNDPKMYVVVDPRVCTGEKREQVYKQAIQHGFWVVHRYNNESTDTGTEIGAGPNPAEATGGNGSQESATGTTTS